MDGKRPLPGGREIFILLWGIFTLYLACVLLVGRGTTPWHLVFYESVIVLPPIFYVLYRRYPFLKVFRLRRVPFRCELLGVLAGFGCSGVSHAWDQVVQKRFPMHPELYEGLNRILGVASSEGWLPLFFGAVCLAGMGEEMLFRGLFQGTVERIGGKGKGILYSAWIFVFLHFNPWWALPLFLMGLIAGWLAWRSQSVYPAIALHITVNGISLLRIKTVWLSSLESHPVVSHPAFLFGLGVLLLLVVLVFFRPCANGKADAVPLPEA